MIKKKEESSLSLGEEELLMIEAERWLLMMPMKEWDRWR